MIPQDLVASTSPHLYPMLDSRPWENRHYDQGLRIEAEDQVEAPLGTMLDSLQCIPWPHSPLLH